MQVMLRGDVIDIKSQLIAVNPIQPACFGTRITGVAMIDEGDRKLIAQANRNGFFYLLNRTSGKLISATSYAKFPGAPRKMLSGGP